MHHLVEPILDGSLAALFPRGVTRALASWLGLVLLAVAGAGALALDLRRRPVVAGGPAASAGAGRFLTPVLLTVVVGCGLLAALATLVRFSLALSS
ncbi:hypothetical protein [Kineococcus sp. NPDC059986]|uniref:hypothetical protein n=1 Tax=Kineococcus sp. NPDC059986 TaxID=3155538 RepID=UPI00344CA88B